MPVLTLRRAAVIAALVAAAVYLGALENRWALDDHGIVVANPAAHSVGAALRAAFSTYWPASTVAGAGLYRPLIILSYAIDWVVSGGAAWWFHFVNIVLHAAVTGLVVAVLGRWLPPAGALVAGLIFGLHPLHVEAVANVVGRAELLANGGLLAAVLAARRYRATVVAGAPRARWLALTVASAAFAMLIKENGVVAVALIALDHWLDPDRRRAGATVDLYVAVVAASLAWFFIWRAIAGPYVATAVAANVRGLDTWGRLATMLPAQLDVVRLLTLPLQLSPDYNPLLIPRRTEWTPLAGVGLIVTIALLGLSVAALRRAPAVAFGLVAGIITYAPTSNLLFGSGVGLSERSLYLAALAPAAVMGWMAVRAGGRERRLLLMAIVVIGFVYAVRTFTRVPFWRDSRTVVVEDLIQHPENFRAHVRVGRILEETGDSARALAAYLTAEEIFPADPFIAPHSVRLALAYRRVSLAEREARRAAAIAPRNEAIALLSVHVAQVRGGAAAVVAAASEGLARIPDGPALAVAYADGLRRIGAPHWRILMARARADALVGRFATASARLDSVTAALDDPALDLTSFCRELSTIRPMIRTLRPALERRATGVTGATGLTCLP